MLIANGDAVLLANFLVEDDQVVSVALVLLHSGCLSLESQFAGLWDPDRLLEDLRSLGLLDALDR
jgi:hypothetical protein